MLKLNLGAGELPLDGWTNLDIKTGDSIFPLRQAENSVDVIRASHVLEHFPHGQVGAVLAEWVRALKPGGLLQIAVPDFGKVAAAYVAGAPMNVQGYVMGGQADADDFHRALFDRRALAQAMGAAGLCLARSWRSEIADCAALPISLNLQGRKAYRRDIRIRAVMSAPRLGFLDMMFCAMEALPPLGIRFTKVGGAFWGHAITKGIEDALAEDCDYVMTLDYDSVFTTWHAATLCELAMVYPEADAIAPLQANRHVDAPLLTLGEKGDADGSVTVAADAFDVDLKQVPSAHFGLTLLKAEKLRALPKPWFHSNPAPDGGWGPGHRPDDIFFWRGWNAAGFSLHLAPRVHIGHAQLMVRWLDGRMKPIWQTAEDFNAARKAPGEAWKGT